MVQPLSSTRKLYCSYERRLEDKSLKRRLEAIKRGNGKTLSTQPRKTKRNVPIILHSSRNSDVRYKGLKENGRNRVNVKQEQTNDDTKVQHHFRNQKCKSLTHELNPIHKINTEINSNLKHAPTTTRTTGDFSIQSVHGFSKSRSRMLLSKSKPLRERIIYTHQGKRLDQSELMHSIKEVQRRNIMIESDPTIPNDSTNIEKTDQIGVISCNVLMEDQNELVTYLDSCNTSRQVKSTAESGIKKRAIKHVDRDVDYYKSLQILSEETSSNSDKLIMPWF